MEFVRERGAVQPREVDDHFSHGAVTNQWGGSSNATTHFLDAMYYRGRRRVARRERGVRIYAVHQHAFGPNDAVACRARVRRRDAQRRSPGGCAREQRPSREHSCPHYSPVRAGRHTFRNFVTRPTSTHSTTKIFPLWSKHAPCGATNLPGVK